MTPAVSDFRQYRWLCREFRVRYGPLERTISVRTATGNPRETTHAQIDREFSPGNRLVRLGLLVLRERARPRPLDLADVRYAQVFAFKLQQPRTVVLSRVWLEP